MGVTMIKIKKIFTIFAVFAIALLVSLLSGCVSDLSGNTVKISGAPVIVNTYNNDAQKIDSIKTNNIKIVDDSELTPAINIKYGDNKVVHTSSSLIAYSGLTNYMDNYRHLQASTNTQDTTSDKSIPTIAHLYGNFDSFDKPDTNLVLVKSKTGTPIGAFVGKDIEIKQIGSTDFPNSVITIDKHKLFVYDCSYTTYPVAALKAAYNDQKVSTVQQQKNVKTGTIDPKLDHEPHRD